MFETDLTNQVNSCAWKKCIKPVKPKVAVVLLCLLSEDMNVFHNQLQQLVKTDSLRLLLVKTHNCKLNPAANVLLMADCKDERKMSNRLEIWCNENIISCFSWELTAKQCAKLLETRVSFSKGLFLQIYSHWALSPQIQTSSCIYPFIFLLATFCGKATPVHRC